MNFIARSLSVLAAVASLAVPAVASAHPEFARGRVEHRGYVAPRANWVAPRYAAPRYVAPYAPRVYVAPHYYAPHYAAPRYYAPRGWHGRR